MDKEQAVTDERQALRWALAAIDSLEKFASAVAPSSGYWDEVWPEHDAKRDIAAALLAKAQQPVAVSEPTVAWLCTDLDGRADVGFTKAQARQRAGEGCTFFYPLAEVSAPAAQQPSDNAKENAIQQAQIWAMEAKTQRAIVISILKALGLPEHDWEAQRLVLEKFDALAQQPSETAIHNAADMAAIMREAADIIAAIRSQNVPKNYRRPIIDELQGFALMLDDLRAATQKARKTWATDGSYKCLNCDKGLTEHEGQVYCPAAREAEKPCKQELIASGVVALPKSCPRCGLSPTCADREQPADERKPLTEAQIAEGWKATFSTRNPFCPCDLHSFTKAVRWAERALAEKGEPK